MDNDPFRPRAVSEHEQALPLGSRLVAAAAFAAIAFAALAFNLYSLQVRQGPEFEALAQGNLVRREVVLPPRGIIFDRHGTQLVTNQGSFDVSIVPIDLPKPGAARDVVLARLTRAIGVSPAEIERLVRVHASEPFQPIVVKQAIDPTTYQVVSENLPMMPGVRIDTGSTRHYLVGAGLSHLLGYTGKLDPAEYKALGGHGYLLDDVIGKTGLEYQDEGFLRGTPGQRVVQTDANGRVVRQVSSTAPVPGDNVYLSIDWNLQQEVARDLQATMTAAQQRVKASHALAGAAIVMNPQTGEVYAMVSLPDYDINQFAVGITTAQYRALAEDPRLPLLNRAIDGLYPPGSTFKPVSGAAALQSGAIGRSGTVVCPGFLQRGNTRFNCWNGGGHGAQDIVAAIAHSCDVFFYTVADSMGDLVLNKFARDFGVGRKTGIDLAPEARGIAPDRNWKKAYFAQAFDATQDPAWKDDFWYEGNTITYGIGQSYLLVTPLQDLMWTATVANGGAYLKPQLTNRVLGVDGTMVRPFSRTVDHQVAVDPALLAIIREGLRTAASPGGTSGFIWSQAAFKDVPSPSGKTGTAQYGVPDAKGNFPLHSWYTAFAPAVDPEVAVVTFVEGGGEGHEGAAPTAAQILEYYFQHRDAIRAN